ncbi:MAG: hypothetical protein IPJ19_20270 [Planctomycetes bacterium]|nr:hypothetical protein [Planctomycetota bacterium]
MSTPGNLVLVGASGMVGGHVLELALAHPQVARVTAIGRRPLGIQHAKLREVLHEDFADCRELAPVLLEQDAALYCIGAYTGALTDAEFRRVTVDLTIEFARVLHEHSPQAAFCFLSGQGADPSEQSRVAFARYKGMAENGLLRAGFARVHLFRPGYIFPVVPRREPNLFYRLLRVIYLVLRPVLPGLGIPSVDLARAMLRVALDGSLAGAAVERRRIAELARG